MIKERFKLIQHGGLPDTSAPETREYGHEDPSELAKRITEVRGWACLISSGEVTSLGKKGDYPEYTLIRWGSWRKHRGYRVYDQMIKHCGEYGQMAGTNGLFLNDKYMLDDTPSFSNAVYTDPNGRGVRRNYEIEIVKKAKEIGELFHRGESIDRIDDIFDRPKWPYVEAESEPYGWEYPGIKRLQNRRFTCLVADRFEPLDENFQPLQDSSLLMIYPNQRGFQPQSILGLLDYFLGNKLPPYLQKLGWE